MEPIINAHAPEFTVQAFQGGQSKAVSSKDIKGKWTLFFFYPTDFTFVYPTELGDLVDRYEQLESLGVEVFSVSTDTHSVHKAWHDTSDRIRKIKCTMLADPTGVLSRGFDVYKEDEGLTCRGTFLVSPEGLVKIAKIQDNSIGRDADELVRKAEAALFIASHKGEVCPAKWKQDGETLKPSIGLVDKLQGLVSVIADIKVS